MSVLYPIPRLKRTSDYVVLAGQKIFGPTGFAVYDAQDVRVRRRAPSGHRWITLTTGFRVELTGPAPAPVRVIFDQTQTTGATLKVRGLRIASRTTDVVLAGIVRAAPLETEFDVQTVTDQELRRDVDDAETRIDDETLTLNDAGEFDARGRVISNVVDGTHGQSAVNLDMLRALVSVERIPIGATATFPNRLAAMVATLEPGTSFVQTMGYFRPGDRGAVLYKVEATPPGHPSYFQTASGEYCNFAERRIYGEQCGAIADDYPDLDNVAPDAPAVTDNTEPFRRLIATASKLLCLAGFGLGAFFHSGQLDLPITVDAAGKSWHAKNPFTLLGEDSELTRVRYDGTDKFGLCHPSMVPSHPAHKNYRQQYGRVTIGQFTHVGPQSWTNNAIGIGIDNVTAGIFRDLRSYGWVGGGTMPTGTFGQPDYDPGDHVGGCSLASRGYNTGGNYGLRAYRCRFGIIGPYEVVGGHTNTRISDLPKYTSRYYFWAWGTYDASGKSNDIVFEHCRFENPLIGAVCTRGTINNPNLATTHEDFVGSTANFLSQNNVYYAQNTARLETGSLEAVLGPRTFRLRTTPGTFIPENDYVGCGISFVVNGIAFAGGYVTAMNGGREITIDRDIPDVTLPCTYFMRFADLRARYDFHPLATQHAILGANRYASASRNDYYERILPYAVWPIFYNSKHSIVDPNPEVNQGIQYLLANKFDALRQPILTPYIVDLAFIPALYDSHTAPFAHAGAHAIRGSVVAYNAENYNDAAPFGFFAINNTGAELRRGNIVRLANNYLAAVSSSYLNADPSLAFEPHFVVWSVLDRPIRQGDFMVLVSAVRNITVKVQATAAAFKKGDLVLNGTGNIGRIVSATDVKAAPWMLGCEIGRLATAYAVTGVTEVAVTIK